MQQLGPQGMRCIDHNSSIICTLLIVIKCLFYAVIYCLSTSHNVMTLAQLEELLRSLTNSSNIYIIMSDGRIFNQTSQFPPEFGLYYLIRGAYSNPRIDTPTDIWLNKAPCSNCVTTLYETFRYRRTKPTLHLETLNFNDTNAMNIIDALQRLTTVQSYGFSVQVWDWTVFSNNFIAERHHCTNSINTFTSNQVYTASKSQVESFLSFIQASSVQGLCL